MELQDEQMYREIQEHHLAEKLLKRQNKLIYPELFVKFEPKGCFLPKQFAQWYNYIQDFEVREDDIWVVSMIKSGTTWTQEMVWLLANNLDYKGAETLLTIRFPYFEFDCTWNVEDVSNELKGGQEMTSMEIVHGTPSPRFIKSHLPLNLLPQKLQNRTKSPKIIYIARNPKDVCVSFYHHRVLIEGYTGSIDEFVDEYINDLSLYAPYWTHVKEFWERKNEPNILFLTYEEMKEDLKAVVLKTAKFLEKSYTNYQIQSLLKHLSFESMKSNASVNYDEVTEYLTKFHGKERKTHFIRKGKVGSWKEELSSESIRKFDKWIKENYIENLWDKI